MKRTYWLFLAILAALIALVVVSPADARTIMSLDNYQGLQVRSNADGAVLRLSWLRLEPGKQRYDCTPITGVLPRLPKGQTLAVIIRMTRDDGTPGEPSDLIRSGVPPPWDATMQARWAQMLKAIAGNMTSTERARIVLLNVEVPGWGAIRETDTSGKIRSIPGYTRDLFIGAAVTSVAAAGAAFPGTDLTIGTWAVNDGTSTPPLWQVAVQSLATIPRVSLYNDNLGTSTPIPSYAAALTWAAQHGIPVRFQALQTWCAPFRDPSKATGTPADGLNYATRTYGSSYVELYAKDLDVRRYQPGIAAWRAGQ